MAMLKCSTEEMHTLTPMLCIRYVYDLGFVMFSIYFFSYLLRVTMVEIITRMQLISVYVGISLESI